MEIFTARLRLESIEERHAELFFDQLQNPDLYRFTPDAPPRTIDELRFRYRALECAHSPDGTEVWLNWAVWSNPEQRYVGYVQATVTKHYNASIAYVFFSDAWGKGYAREAVRRMLDHLNENYERPEFVAFVDIENHRSVSLLQDLGFSRVGIRKGARPSSDASKAEAEYRKRQSC
jgi:[ribosomal protein S5]-alanine N-acetyltransferase